MQCPLPMMKINSKETINKAIDIIASEIAKCAHQYWESLVFDAEGLIIGKNTDGTYKVMLNKQEYNIKNGTEIDFKPGNKCLVHFISGNQNKKVIIAKL